MSGVEKIETNKNPSLPVWQEGLGARWVCKSSLSGPVRQGEKLLLALEKENGMKVHGK